MPKIKLPSMSKTILVVVVLLCIEIIWFCERMMIETGDTSAMYSLIGVVASLVPVVCGYYAKSTKENTIGGIVYDTAMKEKIIYTEQSDSAKG